MDKQVVPPECARILFRISFLTLGSLSVAWRLGVYEGVVVNCAVFLCSTNYWRRPVYGIRRNIDIANAISCLLYQTWRCFDTEPHYTAGFIAYTYSGIGLFFIGRRLDEINPMYGTYAHAIFHVLANIGNIILYTGLKNTSPS